MSEIRSTIDIMMERTRGMLMSDEDKERLKNEELQKKAKGYALKLMDPGGPNPAALSKLYEESPENLSILEKYVLKEIVDLVSTESDLALFFDRFENWPFASSKKREIEEFLATYQNRSKNKNKDKKIILEHAKKKLADSGILGSAVVPKFSKNLESSSLTDLLQQFSKMLSQI
ncbi:MAG: hypothetical protein ACP5VS_19335 [Desulfomonilaceae bacterium]